MLNYFCYNGEDSRDYGILIKSKNSYNAPERGLSFQSVPGRDGDLVFDSGNYSNVRLSYNVGILTKKMFEPNANIDAVVAMEKIKEWLYYDIGNYLELYDSYDPDYYRKAVFTTGLEIESSSPNYLNSTITFNCKPYRYAQYGKNTIELTGNGTITNPERYKSLPLIRLYGTQQCFFTVKGYRYDFDFTGTGISWVDIDSEKESVYHNYTSYVSKYSPSSVLFPEFDVGSSVITIGGNTTKLIITPNWRAI